MIDLIEEEEREILATLVAKVKQKARTRQKRKEKEEKKHKNDSGSALRGFFYLLLRNTTLFFLFVLPSPLLLQFRWTAAQPTP
ncbi:hypothetical protein ACTXT7_010534 [Hymenolepis weldensis]